MLLLRYLNVCLHRLLPKRFPCGASCIVKNLREEKGNRNGERTEQCTIGYQAKSFCCIRAQHSRTRCNVHISACSQSRTYRMGTGQVINGRGSTFCWPYTRSWL